MKDRRPITSKQLKYLNNLIKKSADRTTIDNIEESNALKVKIEEIGVQNLTLEDAREYISIFKEFDNLYQDQYETDTSKIDDSIKIIDFTKYLKS